MIMDLTGQHYKSTGLKMYNTQESYKARMLRKSSGLDDCSSIFKELIA